MTITEFGYLERPYLSDPYLSGGIHNGQGMQVRIVQPAPPVGFQAKIFPLEHNLHPFYLVEPFGYLQEPYLATKICAFQGMQVDLSLATQFEQGIQVDARNNDQLDFGLQAKIFPLEHNLHPFYLTEPFGYLSEAYLASKICAFQGMQVDQLIDSSDDDFPQGFQVDQKITEALANQGFQALLRIYDEQSVGFQADVIRAERLGISTTMVLYNITQMRILCDFLSRGTAALGGNNWTSPQGVDVGDFDLSNLNTDVVEQRAQSPVGVAALWEIRCNTGIANGFADTYGILNHNLTSSATVTVQGSDDPAFGSVKWSFVMTTELVNMYYIEPDLPTIPAQYFRFLIQDPLNPDGQIKIGTIVFGNAIIFSKKSCFDLPVTFGLRHFKDGLQTEGFTNYSNDRALRKILQLNFSDHLFDGADYQNFQDYFKTAKTDLKCLVIPTPQRPSALAVFSKLTQLPEETHNAVEPIADGSEWRVNFSLDYDESM